MHLHYRIRVSIFVSFRCRLFLFLASRALIIRWWGNDHAELFRARVEFLQVQGHVTCWLPCVATIHYHLLNVWKEVSQWRFSLAKSTWWSFIISAHFCVRWTIACEFRVSQWFGRWRHKKWLSVCLLAFELSWWNRPRFFCSHEYLVQCYLPFAGLTTLRRVCWLYHIWDLVTRNAKIAVFFQLHLSMMLFADDWWADRFSYYSQGLGLSAGATFSTILWRADICHTLTLKLEHGRGIDGVIFAWDIDVIIMTFILLLLNSDLICLRHIVLHSWLKLVDWDDLWVVIELVVGCLRICRQIQLEHFYGMWLLFVLLLLSTVHKNVVLGHHHIQLIIVICLKHLLLQVFQCLRLRKLSVSFRHDSCSFLSIVDQFRVLKWA